MMIVTLLQKFAFDLLKLSPRPGLKPARRCAGREFLYDGLWNGTAVGMS
jgi:hypothetical protein